MLILMLINLDGISMEMKKEGGDINLILASRSPNGLSAELCLVSGLTYLTLVRPPSPNLP